VRTCTSPEPGESKEFRQAPPQESPVSRRVSTAPSRRLRKSLAAVPVIAAAVGGTLAVATPANASSTWAELRQCESGGNYSTNTGNGYYGAYQFSAGTWQSLGYSGLPSAAAPAVQDEAAQRLAQRSGFGQWPVCGRGMGPDQLAPGASSAGASQASRSAPRSPSPLVVQPASSTTAHLPFTTSLARQYRADVQSWQAQMKKIGYSLAVDGHYGRRSADAARALQRDRGLAVDGVVGPKTWAATFA
jgi:hypothetical protein